MVLYSDSSSSRQLIARKGLGKARHLDVDLLWIQRIDNLKIKPIKGKDNPADLGTKSLTRDKIRKHMLMIGYIGDYLEEGEPVDNGEVDVRMAQGKRKVDEGRLQRIIHAVTMAVLIGLGAAHKEASKSIPESEDDEETGPTMCMVLVSAEESKEAEKAEESKEAGKAEESKDTEILDPVEEPDLDMSMAEVCREAYMLSDAAIDMLLEENKKEGIRSALEILESKCSICQADLATV